MVLLISDSQLTLLLDVQDLNWSPDNHLLVSVGLDSAIMVWNAQTFGTTHRQTLLMSRKNKTY